MRQAVSIRAPAKVNLLLRVLGPRGDGFHELETIFQAIDFSDELTVELAGDSVELEVTGADLGPITDNLAVRAAEAFRRVAGLETGVRIRLAKHIPAGAGLGGGSSDAAAVLRALQHLTGEAVAAQALSTIGAELGSDVPFFLCGSPLALARGRGEDLSPWPPLPVAHVVVVCPPVHVATADAYAALSRSRLSTVVSTRADLDAAPTNWESVVELARNDFESVVADRHPEVRAARESLSNSGMQMVMLSGSGAACFGFARGAKEAESTADRLSAELGWRVKATRSLDEVPSISLM